MCIGARSIRFVKVCLAAGLQCLFQFPALCAVSWRASISRIHHHLTGIILSF